MDQVIKKFWTDRLRSGQDKQTIGKLCTINSEGRSYCCLGVLTDIGVNAGVIEERENDSRPYVVHYDDYENSETTLLPLKIQEWADLHDENPKVKVTCEEFLEFHLSKQELDEVYILEMSEDWFGSGHGFIEEKMFSLSEVNDDLEFDFPKIAELIDAQL